MFGLENYNFLKSIRFVDLLEGMKITHLSIYIFLNHYEAQYLPPLAENFCVIVKNHNTKDPKLNAKVCHITY